LLHSSYVFAGLSLEATSVHSPPETLKIYKLHSKTNLVLSYVFAGLSLEATSVQSPPETLNLVQKYLLNLG
jgi:hypothetical protein